ncbi:MAG: D-alanine--D-alanine ligase [Bacteroidia bacterium]
MKLRVGIIFGGYSREREVSFAGGRTVYDNLNKSLFEPIPIFVDSFGNFVILDWKYIYKGSIRDFYPPVEYLPPTPHHYQVYAESLKDAQVGTSLQHKMLQKLGKPVKAEELKNHIDFAFLCLHGSGGEDGTIQGLLDYVKIPYSGSGIFSSALGMNKAIQRRWMQDIGMPVPEFIIINREDGFDTAIINKLYKEVKQKIGIPCVIKPASQGSSIGATVLMQNDYASFEHALLKAFFLTKLSYSSWKNMNKEQRIDYIREIGDIREGIGFPLLLKAPLPPKEGKTGKGGIAIYHPEDLLKKLTATFQHSNEDVVLEAYDSESEVMIETFLRGKEFSCIVIQDENGKPIALPPTEIRKGQELFDYRSKYLPGLSRKITPIDLPEERIKQIADACCNLFSSMHFNVYARIDGFITDDDKIYLNDPNTTSGMLPSSFFFHQAAEIGLNPSRFLTYIIRASLQQRISQSMYNPAYIELLNKTDLLIGEDRNKAFKKKKIAVILGGYSSERHISVESGRNIYEKLASSAQYEPIPIFLAGKPGDYSLYQIPINILLKDNADDIREKIEHFHIHPYIEKIQKECESITEKYSSGNSLIPPRKLTYAELAEEVDGVFIALHGRPGEDGEVQIELGKVGLPFNGSSATTSAITINKYETNNILRHNGLLVPDDIVITCEECKEDTKALFNKLKNKLGLPFIAKPIDDGCSSAVRKIDTGEEFNAFIKLIFRETAEKDKLASEILKIKSNEEFPQKKAFLAEEMIRKKGAQHLLEITGGLLTHYNGKKKNYEIFEASEALSGGAVLSLEEKFLAGEGQNITPARYAPNPKQRLAISDKVKAELKKAALLLNIEGYARIDAFVRIYKNGKVEVIFIEVNSLPGMTPATCIFHQTAINGYTPFGFIDAILNYSFATKKANSQRKNK